jgi:glycine/D-amino acid oxidase-like deaminating enzyme
VLGAGIVGTSIALHLAKRGLSVALIDRAGVGEHPPASCHDPRVAPLTLVNTSAG